jgi:hypothetical protein
MEIFVGPLLSREGRYCYATFTLAEGTRGSFRYTNIEQARYDRRAMLAEMRAARRNLVHDCETEAEFERLVAAARQPMSATPA